MNTRHNFLVRTLVLLFLLLSFSCSQKQQVKEEKISIIYSTDLYHPHEDPDDHFDIATMYAFDEIEIKLVVIDNAKKNNDAETGRIPIAQLNRMTGRNVPHAVGLTEKLKSPDDDGL